MTQDNVNKRLAELLEEYHRRRALGEAANPEDFRESMVDLLTGVRCWLGRIRRHFGQSDRAGLDADK